MFVKKNYHTSTATPDPVTLCHATRNTTSWGEGVLSRESGKYLVYIFLLFIYKKKNNNR